MNTENSLSLGAVWVNVGHAAHKYIYTYIKAMLLHFRVSAKDSYSTVLTIMGMHLLKHFRLERMGQICWISMLYDIFYICFGIMKAYLNFFFFLLFLFTSQMHFSPRYSSAYIRSWSLDIDERFSFQSNLK